MFLLGCEDPKYPKHNFYQEILQITEKQVSALTNLDAGSFDARKSLHLIAEELVKKLDADGRWREVTESWYSSDIANALLTLFPEHGRG